jgi:starch synthase
MDLVDIVLKGDEFLQDQLKNAFDKTETTKSEYIDASSINNLY